MKILVIDGQGGGMGRQLVDRIKKTFPEAEVTAVGTNSAATQAMMKAGPDHVATGENAVIVGCRGVDVIIGPIGIAIADSLWGEISPNMAKAVGQSDASRILLPMNICNNYVTGVSDKSTSELIDDALVKIKSLWK